MTAEAILWYALGALAFGTAMVWRLRVITDAEAMLWAVVAIACGAVVLWAVDGGASVAGYILGAVAAVVGAVAAGWGAHRLWRWSHNRALRRRLRETGEAR